MASPILDNVVRLVAGVPKELHFTDHSLGPVEMADPVTAVVRAVQTLAFVVDIEDGSPVNKLYYVTSDRHAQDFAPYLADRSYVGYTWIITRRGEGLQARWTVARIPFANPNA
jgi:hypothetical protein